MMAAVLGFRTRNCREGLCRLIPRCLRGRAGYGYELALGTLHSFSPSFAAALPQPWTSVQSAPSS